jgi:Protein of unknown function (DUF4058)
MPSPLPGMNPFLESPELWSEFYSRMIVAIADALSENLVWLQEILQFMVGRS